MLKKKIIPVFLASVLTVSGTTGFVTEAFSENAYAAEEVHTERLADFADLLDDGQEEELEAKLDQVSEDYGCDVVVVTEETLDGAVPQDYADDFFDYYGYGYGEGKDGILFLVSMEDRDWALSTHGYGITAFTDAGIQYVGGQMLDSLADGDYAQAFRIYAACCDDLIDQARAGHPFDKDDVPRKPMSATVPLICIAIGAALGFATVQGMKAQLKSVHKAGSAANYVRPGSMNLTGKQDLFLYSHVNRVKRETKSSSSSGGGSSTHTSSSGTTHGGGGGKF